MAEDLTEYMHEAGIRVRYMHSDIETLERIEIIRDLRLGAFDVLIGINLLREGLDIPECALVAILDADKEGFLRSRDLADPDHRPRRAQRRRPRHPLRRPASPARWSAPWPRPTGGARSSSPTTPPTASRRRASSSNIHDVMSSVYEQDHVTVDIGLADSADGRPQPAGRHRGPGDGACTTAAADLEFETAARLRDEIKRLRDTELAIADDPLARQAEVEDKAGGFKGARKYGAKANVLADRAASPETSRTPNRASSVPSPLVREGQGGGMAER